MSEGVNVESEPASRRVALRDSPFVRDVLAPFLLARGVLALAASAALAFATPRPGFHADAIGPVDALVRWDAVHYLSVAERGYGHGSDAFFPLFPAITRALGMLVPLPYAAVWASNAACLVALELLRRLVTAEHEPALARRAVWLALVFPTGFFLSAAYAESTYLACTLLVFVAAREERRGLAAIAVWLACLARPQGFLCATAPFVLGWLAGDRSLRRFPWFVLGAVPALGQLLAMHHAASGDPLGFLHSDTVQSLRVFWAGPRAEPPPMLAVLAHEGFGPNLIRRLLNASALVLLAVCAVLEARQRRWDRASLVVLTVAIPLYFQRTLFDAASMARYATLAFPVYAQLARGSARAPVGRLLDTSFPLLQLVFFVAFASWVWAE